MAVEQIIQSSVFSSPLLMPLLAIVFVLTAVHFWQMTRRERKIGDLLPGPPTVPIIGNAYYFLNSTNHGNDQKLFEVKSFKIYKLQSILEIFNKAIDLVNCYGSVVRGWVGHKLFVGLSDPRDVEIILGSHDHIDKSDEYKLFQPWFGNGLLISTGEKWRTHRKLIAPAFHMNVLKSFMSTFNDNSRFVIKKLMKEAGKEFDCHDYMSEATVDILLETAMGSKRTSESEEGFKYAMAVMK